MALSIIGTPAAVAATSITLPTHAVGDLIVIWAFKDGATTVPTKPTASGTVPAWVDILAPTGANTCAARSAYFFATATNHTSGTWTGATGLEAIVIRGAHPAPIGGANQAGGTGANTQTAPAITQTQTDGTSMLLQFFGNKTVTAWGAAPAGYTRQASVATEVCLNTKDTTTTDGTNVQTSTSTSSGWRAEQIEILALPTPTFTFVQAAGSGHGTTGGFGPQTATFPGAVTAGDLLVCAWVGNSNVGPATCADNINAGNWQAGTERTPFSGSGRRQNWFWKIATASASAGTMTVTVSPNANAGNSEWMHIMEWSPTNGIDSAVEAYGVHASGTAVSQAGGTPTQAGDLVLLMFASDSENTNTATLVWPTTSFPTDGSGQFAGKANGQYPLTVGALNGAPSTAVTMAFGIGAGDDGGKYVIGFSPFAGSTVTKTQSAISRIARNPTLTQAAISRIAKTIPKTQPAISRIANVFTKTQAAISRVANSVPKTQPAVAKIASTVTKAQTAISRVATSRPFTQSAVSRIAKVVTKTQTAVANIVTAGTVTKTQSAISRIAKSVPKTQSAISRIANARTLLQAAISRISQTYTKTQPGVSRIAKSVPKTQPAVARIIGSVSKLQTAISRIANARTKLQTAISRISQTYTKTQPGVSRIAKTVTKTQTAIAALLGSRIKTQPAISRIATKPTKNQSAISRIAIKPTYAQAAISRISRIVTKTQTAVAYLYQPITRTKTQTAIAKINNSRSITITARARITTNPPTTTSDTASSVLLAQVLAAILASASTVVRRAEIYEEDGVTPFVLDPGLLGGSVTCSISRTERRTFEILFSNSDGRLDNYPGNFWYDKVIKIFRGVRYGTDKTIWETQIGEFMIDNIKTQNFPVSVAASGRDYMKKLINSKLPATTTFTAGATIEATIKTIALNGGVTKFNLPVTGKTLGRDFTWDRGTERQQCINDIATAYGFEVFFDGQGFLVLRAQRDPTTSPETMTFQTGGTTGNLGAINKTSSDTQIYNHIVVTGESSDTSVLPVSAEAINTAPTSPTRVSELGDRLYEYTSSFITTVAQAQAVANAFLAVHALESFELGLNSLVLPWIEGGDIARFIDPRPMPGDPIRYLITDFTIPLELGLMSVTGKRITIVG